MGVQQPSLDTLARIADQYGFDIPADRLATFHALIGHSLASYGRLDELVEPSLPVSYPRQPGHRPPPEANPLGAWYWKSEIRGAATGPLAGKTVAIKDNVCVAGVFPIELTLDHVGPIARSASDVALLLEAIAGPDGLDPRQRAGLMPQPYTQALTGEASGLRIGIVDEGFNWGTLSERDVDEAVHDAGHAFERLGCSVSSVSIPWHRDGIHVWNGVAVEGATALMVAGNSMGTNWKGHYTTSLLDVYAHGRLTRACDLSETVKLTVMLGQYLKDAYHGRYYARSQNLARSLGSAYDEALAQVDLLVMPTLPLKATRIPDPNGPLEEYVARALEMIVNTAPFDVTGHPAMNVPCAMSEGLPIGMMLVGRTGEDATVLRAADAFQRQVFSPPG